MNIVDYLLEFQNEEKSEMLVGKQNVDMTILRVITIELLSWMKLQQKRLLWMESGKKTSLKPLTLNMSYPWCSTLCQYVETQEVFKNVFEICDGKLDFRKDIPKEYVTYAFQTAYEKHNPQMIVG